MVGWDRIIRIRRLAAMASLAIALAPLLTGCATNSKVDDDINDLTDPCHVQRLALGELRTNMVAETAKGVIGGMILGTIVGAGTAIATGQDVRKGVVKGIIVGGVLGGISGYYGALQSKSGQDPNIFYSSFINDANQEHERIQKANRRLDDLLACRKQRLKSIRAAYRHKEIDRATAQVQMDELRTRLQGDLGIASEIRKDVVDRAKNIQFAGLKVAPNQVSYVDFDEVDDYDSGKRKSKGRTRIRHKAPPPEVNKQLAELPAPPKADRSNLASVATGVNMNCGEALLTNKKCSELGKLASGSGLELDKG